MHTRTFVRYFGGDEYDALCTALGAAEGEWLGRRPHVDSETQKEGDDRLTAARLAILRMGDRVP